MKCEFLTEFYAIKKYDFRQNLDHVLLGKTSCDQRKEKPSFSHWLLLSRSTVGSKIIRALDIILAIFLWFY